MRHKALRQMLETKHSIGRVQSVAPIIHVGVLRLDKRMGKSRKDS